jgi:NAD(P) transhydrogenase subunit alpha
VLGAGVAGLSAIGTARRLGAVVRAFDVRPSARDEVASLGATFVELGRELGGAGDGGYARALTADEQGALPDLLAPEVAKADIVITTAQVPGRAAPVLVSDDALKAMAAGSVVVDLAAGPHGGNVACAQAGRTVVTDNGVSVIGADNLPALVPVAASTAYSHNVVALLRHLIRDGRVVIDPDDEIGSGVVVIRDGLTGRPPAEGAHR